MAGVVASMLLPWQQTVGGDSVVRGININEGVLVIIASVLTIGLIQVELRPAWMGAGFVVAVLGRQVLSSDATVSVGSGPMVGLILAGATAVLLTTSMIRTLSRSAEGNRSRTTAKG